MTLIPMMDCTTNAGYSTTVGIHKRRILEKFCELMAIGYPQVRLAYHLHLSFVLTYSL